jgi:hypothetical protein
MIKNKKDLKVSSTYDLVFSKKENEEVSLEETNSFPYETLMQVIYIALRTDKGDFKLQPSFGANPKKYLGRPVSRLLVEQIEKDIVKNLMDSKIIDPDLALIVKGVPLNQTIIALQIKIIHPITNSIIYRMNMLASTSDGHVTPLLNGILK